jgi:protoheme IX farnesyltransferase
MRHNTAMDYVRAAQPRVVALFLLTVVVAMLLAGPPGASLIIAVTLAAGLSVGGAALLNNYLERDVDKRMERTRRRPIAAGAVSPGRALAVGLCATTAGVLALLLVAGTPAAVFALCGAAYYVVVYTLILKPRTALSALPGGIAGVFPALIGWTAAGGGWSAEILFVCVFIVAWSPPHFWALSLALRDEYASSGIPTPAVAYGERATRLQILAFVALLTALTAAPLAGDGASSVYLLTALVADAVLWLLAIALLRRRTVASAWAFFKFSGPYLAAILVALVVDQLG